MAFFTESLFLDILSILTSAITISYVYFKWAFQYWKRKHLPYLEPTIPFGNLENPFSSTRSLGEFISELYKQAKTKGWKHCGIYGMASPIYLVVDLELVKHVLTKDFNYFMDRGVYTNEKVDPLKKGKLSRQDIVAGCNLFALEGTRWKNLRAKLTPTFTSGKLKAMFQTLVDCGLVLEAYLEQHVNSNVPIDIKEVSGYFTADVIGSCAFGIECNSFKHPNSPFLEYGNKAFTESKVQALKELFLMNFPNLARWLKLRRVPKDISDFYTKVVEDTVAYREKNNIVRNDFMQLLIDSKNEIGEHYGDGKSLTMSEIAAQSFVFFVAGYETSSSTISFALFELATHPEIQDRVREEIKTILARHDDQITYDSINELTYMNQVIDETLRIFSPARILLRECVQDYKVPGEDVVIEKGTTVFVPIKGIHYDEEYHKNPKIFDPDRFNEANKRKMNHYAHLPFGQGPRSCIGERFGLMQVKVGLTCVLRKFKVSLNEKTILPLTISPRVQVTSAEGGIWLNIDNA